jgi:hypothetical protein
MKRAFLGTGRVSYLRSYSSVDPSTALALDLGRREGPRHRKQRRSAFFLDLRCKALDSWRGHG